MRKYLLGLLSFAIAFGILSVSFIASSSPRYAFAAPSETQVSVLGVKNTNVEYYLPYAGRVTPDSSLWSFKAFRDNAKVFLTRNPLKKANALLLISDKRLSLAQDLFNKEKPELGFDTLKKGESYLSDSYETSKDVMTTEFATKLALSSLKHRQIIEEIVLKAPEDAKPEIIKVLDTSKNTYNNARDFLNSKGIKAPVNPFETE